MTVKLGLSTRSRRYPQLKDGWAFINSDYSGGLNTLGAPYLIAENQTRDALNVHTTSQGIMRKRNGFTTLATLSTGSPTKIVSLAAANLSTKLLLAVDDTGRLYKITTGGTATALTTGLSGSARWEWVEALSGSTTYMFGMNGTDAAKTYDGTTLAAWTASTGSLPNGQYMAYNGARIWVAGTTANPARVYFSGVTGTAPDPFNWDANNYVDLEPGDGQAITALAAYGPYILAFKPHKTFVIYDLTTGANRKLSDSTGCIANRSVVETPQGAFFLSESEGVMVTDGSKVEQVSSNITPDLQAAAVSQTTLSKAAGAYSGYCYYLSLSTDLSVNDHTYEYDLQTSSWWKHDCASNQFALLDPNGTPVLYSANPSAARAEAAFVANTYTDNAANYAGKSFWTGPHQIFTQPHTYKRLREVRVDGVGTWTAALALNFSDTFGLMEGVVWDSAGDTSGVFGTGATGTFGTGASGTFAPTTSAKVDVRYYTPAYGRAFSYKFQNDDAADWQLYSSTSAVIPRSD